MSNKKAIADATSFEAFQWRRLLMNPCEERVNAVDTVWAEKEPIYEGDSLLVKGQKKNPFMKTVLLKGRQRMGSQQKKVTHTPSYILGICHMLAIVHRRSSFSFTCS